MGCAGLSLAVRLIQSGKFSDKKILLIDKEPKKENDRTWCFWEKKEGIFQHLIYKEWKQVWIRGKKTERLLNLAPYQYKLIRGIDFYRYGLELISQQSNFTIQYATVKRLYNQAQFAFAETSAGTFQADYIFNSILFEKPVLKENEYLLNQQFAGWFIEAAEPVFNPLEATLMDFRVEQQGETHFVYVLPFSNKTALVEFTRFSKSLVESVQLEEGLQSYIRKFINTENYSITEKESGNIPMTNYRFAPVKGRIINMGTAGGQTKGSSGYTFQFVQKHTNRLVQSLINKKNPFIARPNGFRRFHFYDSVLLSVLVSGKVPGEKIFTQLFSKNKPQQVLRFLDNESKLSEELKIISSLPTLPFFKAAWRQRKK